jgi:hypothetical protein
VYLSDIRAAVATGQRPSAVILNDAYAGHRKWWDPWYKPTPIMASVWTEWDYILLRVYQYMQDYTSANGHPVWVEEDPDVGWEIEKVESGYERAIWNYREHHEVKEYEGLRAKPIWEDDVEAPSMEKWLKRMDEESESGFPAMPGGGTPRPPTAEELARLRNPEAN